MQEKKKHNIPPLRFAGFTEEWQEKKLGECVVVERGERVVKKELIENGVYPVISGGVSPLGFLNTFNRDANTITIAQYGTAGFVNLQSQNFWANDVCYSLYPQDITTEFLYPWLKGKQEYIYTLNTTAIPAHLPQVRLEELPISFPSPKEQEQIGEFFRALDELIGAKEEELEKLRQMKSALLEAIFPNEEKKTNVNGGGYKYIDIKHLSEDLYLSAGSADTPRLRFRGFTEPWQHKKLGEVTAQPLDYGLSVSACRYDGKTKYLRITDIDEDTRLFIKSDLTSPFLGEVPDNYILEDGDIVFARTGSSVGKTYFYSRSDGRVAFAGFLVRAKICKQHNPYFVFIHTLTKRYNDLIKLTSQRTGQPGVNAQEYESFDFPFPSLAEQERIGEFFRSQDEGIAAVGEQVERLRAMKQACLERMFA